MVKHKKRILPNKQESKSDNLTSWEVKSLKKHIKLLKTRQKIPTYLFFSYICTKQRVK